VVEHQLQDCVNEILFADALLSFRLLSLHVSWIEIPLEGRLKSNSIFLISSAYYDIRCSWSVVDHHAADKENLAKSSH